MNQSIELLQNVVKAARTGAGAIQLLMDKTDDTALRQSLFDEKTRYQQVETDASQRLMQLGGKARPESIAARTGLRMGVGLNTLADRSSSRLADLLIRGNSMGIVSLTRAKNACADADPESVSLCDRMLRLQHDSIERAKSFLN